MPSGADFKPVRFSTWDLPQRERLDRWPEELGRRIVGVDIEPCASHAPFYAEATLQALPGCRIASCACSARRLNRTPTLAADGEDSIGPVMNHGPKVVMSQRGREAPLQQDHATLLIHQEPAAFTHRNSRYYGG